MTEPNAADAPSDKAIILALAHHITQLDPGDRVALRRLRLETPSPVALGLVIRLLSKSGANDKEFRLAKFRRWTLLLQILALLIGTAGHESPHKQGRTLGLLLNVLLTHNGAREPKESDLRLLTLLKARGEAFDILLVRMARRLAASNVAQIDAVALWQLIIEPDDKDQQRLQIAQDFYRGPRPAKSSVP